MLATHSQVLSGSKQHIRNKDGALTDDGQTYKRIIIGKNCWVGAGAIVMADLGDDVSVSPGSVVAHRARSGSVVVGNPAMPVRFRQDTEELSEVCELG
jgi:acetyltransferase-like isoleucine patch superfamily enzyme